MPRHLPWVILALSLLINLFFLGGYFTAEYEGEGRGDSIAEVAEELDLTLKEQEALAALKRDLSGRMASFREKSGETRAERYRRMLEVIAAEPYEPAKLEALLAERREGQTAFWIAAGKELNQFLRQLPPDKRQRFLDRAAEDRRFLGRLLFGWGRRDRK